MKTFFAILFFSCAVSSGLARNVAFRYKVDPSCSGNTIFINRLTAADVTSMDITTGTATETVVTGWSGQLYATYDKGGQPDYTSTRMIIDMTNNNFVHQIKINDPDFFDFGVKIEADAYKAPQSDDKSVVCGMVSISVNEAITDAVTAQQTCVGNSIHTYTLTVSC